MAARLKKQNNQERATQTGIVTIQAVTISRPTPHFTAESAPTGFLGHRGRLNPAPIQVLEKLDKFQLTLINF